MEIDLNKQTVIQTLDGIANALDANIPVTGIQNMLVMTSVIQALEAVKQWVSALPNPDADN